LKINYEDLQISNTSSLVVTWLVDGRTDGAMVGIPTTVSKANKAVIADLVHFSDYALGEN
jgi:hypothetical protein